MAAAARLHDSITGTTAGEHSGHIAPHGAVQITGNISGGCWDDVLINGMPAATKGSTTIEYDECCGSSQGSVAEGSSSVFIHGVPAARKGDALNAHNGTGEISAGSENVFIGG